MLRPVTLSPREPPGRGHGRARVGGGDINEAWRVTLADGGTAFVKTRADAAPGEYAAEAEGLGGSPSPARCERRACSRSSEDYLALEWIEPGRLTRREPKSSDAGWPPPTPRARH